ncbi:MAG: peptidase M23 [Phenylobacterium zucineum]|nr:MAG: peptidase M23 [Phenylobacterium zucineum]
MGLGALAGVVALPHPAAAQAVRFSLPLACRGGLTCVVQNYVDTDPGPGTRDYRCGGQTYDGHNGVDIRIPDMAAERRGVAVLAAASGTVLRLRNTAPDVSIRAADAPSVVGQECGNGLVIDHGEGWETQYCHLAQGSLVVKPGQRVERGAILGQVGLSGMTEFPHLHLTVRHNGKVVDPFGPNLAPGRCNSTAIGNLWDPETAQALAYRAGTVLNAGFSSGTVTMDEVEQATPPRPDLKGAFLVGYVRAIHLMAGDVQVLTITGPKGDMVAQAKLPPLDHDKAQTLVYAGLRRPAMGWTIGVYDGRYQVFRGGREVVSKAFATRL